MRSTTALLHLALCLFSVTTLASAWPGWLPEVESLVVRADESSDSAETATASEGSSAAEETASETGKGSTELNTAEAETKTGDSTATKTKDSEDETHTTFAANSPPGGVNMITPASTAVATPLYKVGDWVTFGWNYTSLLGTPTAIDVLVSCSVASQTWELTSNMTFETNVDYLWNTNDSDVSDKRLVSEMYTLIVKDSDADISDTPEPGYLGVYSGFTFGLYTPQPYVPFDQWDCAGCNAAPSDVDRRALGFAVTMSLITVFSFTWFVTGLGLQ